MYYYQCLLQVFLLEVFTLKICLKSQSKKIKMTLKIVKFFLGVFALYVLSIFTGVITALILGFVIAVGFIYFDLKKIKKDE